MSIMILKTAIEEIPEKRNYFLCNKQGCRNSAIYRLPFCIAGTMDYRPSLLLCEEHTDEYLSLFKDGETIKEV